MSAPIPPIPFRDLDAHICRRSFEQFCRRFWDQVPGAAPLRWNWHMTVICDVMQRIAERVFAGLPKEEDILINISPGTSKSTLVSIMFTAWTWTRMPQARHISASHASQLVLDLSNKSRDVVQSALYRAMFPEVQLVSNQDAKGHFRNTAGGERYSCTVGGISPMGIHAHFHLCDDLIDPKGARSVVELDSARHFLTAVLPSRKVDKAVTPMVLVMQRIAVGDPTDVMLSTAKKEDACPVSHYCFPAELSERVHPPEMVRYYEENGKLFDPQRMPKRVLDRERAAMTEFDYQTQYMQHPSIPGGSMFKDQFFNLRVRSAPYKARRVRFWDRACLVAGTMVTTSTGSIPIEEVVAGDFVLTRRGFKRVTRSWLTKYTSDLTEVEFSDGRVLKGTHDHPVWVVGAGWVEMASLRSGDCAIIPESLEYHTWQRSEENAVHTAKVLSSMGSITPASTGRATSPPGATRNLRAVHGPILCTGPYGASITEKYQPGMTSTTRTGMWTTTTSAIWIASPERTTTGCTTVSVNGTNVRRRKNTVSARWQRGGRKLPIETRCVGNVEKISRHGTQIINEYVSVLRSAVRTTRIARLTGSVRRVVACSRVRAEPITVRSVRQLECAAVPVYDLTVEGAHEFFANGILVHNSTKDGGCATAGVLMARDDEGNYHVEDVVYGQWEPDERNARILATALKDRRRYGKYEPKILVEEEGGSAGRDAWKGVVRKLAGFTVLEVRVTGKKDVRAEPWATQLAAGNVKIVDNGESQGQGRADWDIDGYVQEHVNFRPDPSVKRLGGMKDRVDASSGAFNWLASTRGRDAPILKTFTFQDVRRKVGPRLRVLVVARDELPLVVTDHPAVVVEFCDPIERPESEVFPAHGITTLVGRHRVRCADVDPETLQDVWGQELPGLGCTPEQAVLTRDHCRSLWAFLTRDFSPTPELVIFMGGEKDGRSISAAYAFIDTLGHTRSQVMVTLDDDDNDVEGPAPNGHIYRLIKSGRNLVSR